MAEFYDTHAHLDFGDYSGDLEEVLRRAAEAGITKIICIGTDAKSSERAVRLAEEHEEVFAAVGWHPGHASEAPLELPEAFRDLARHPKVVAIGETGLDYAHLPSESGGTAEADLAYKAKQREIFRQQLSLAAEAGLNCVIHQRHAFDDTVEEMGRWRGKVRGVFHCFVNGPSELERVLAMGSIVSFTGIVTFKNAADVRSTAAAAPLGQFMLETDSPFLAPVPHRGKRCEPAYVTEIAKVLAEVKRCTMEELSGSTCRTAKEFFRGIAASG